MELSLFHQNISQIGVGDDDHVKIIGFPPDANRFGVGMYGFIQIAVDPTGIPEDGSSHTSYALRDGTAIGQLLAKPVGHIPPHDAYPLASLHNGPEPRQWFPASS